MASSTKLALLALLAILFLRPHSTIETDYDDKPLDYERMLEEEKAFIKSKEEERRIELEERQQQLEKRQQQLERDITNLQQSGVELDERRGLGLKLEENQRLDLEIDELRRLELEMEHQRQLIKRTQEIIEIEKKRYKKIKNKYQC